MDQITPKPVKQFKVIGTRPLRPDGIEKVTGKAIYGADLSAPNMLYGLMLRINDPHALIESIDISIAEKLPGVKSIITFKDFIKLNPNNKYNETLENCIANEKVLYDGHAVAAVAAVDLNTAKKAIKSINVKFKKLPFVINIEDAMKKEAPLVAKGKKNENIPDGFSDNVVQYCSFGHGNLEQGFNESDKVIKRTFKTPSVHQGYIEPHACLASMSDDGKADLWCCTQGHYNVRSICSNIFKIDNSQLKVTASEIGGGFGGKTTVFIEPIALALSQKSGRPVKIVMSREEVFKATGPTVSSLVDVKIGMKKNGKISAAKAIIRYEGGAFPNETYELGAQSAFAAYDLKSVKTEAYNVLTNRPAQAAYRAPGAPQAIYAVESVIDELCQYFNHDPLYVRILNAADKGTKSSYGPTFEDIGLKATLEAAKVHSHYKTPLKDNQGRGVACGFWFNFGGNTCVSLNINFDGTVGIVEGNPDIGGSRSSISQIAAEELGISLEKVKTIIADTNSLGHNDVTDGSRVTFSVGLATIKAAKAAKKELCKRAAKLWGIDEEAVIWKDGYAYPAGANAGIQDPLSLEDIAKVSSQTGGPIAGHYEVNAEGAGVSFGVHLVDVETDLETGHIKILRYTVFQDAGKAIHPSYVEGQMQGGSVQGIGWALNEEYIYSSEGKLQNPGFLDYRIPVSSDLPMIDPVILEIPNPGHPYGVRGVGETSIVPPLAAINNAVSRATNIRFSELPLSPPRVLKAILSNQ